MNNDLISRQAAIDVIRQHAYFDDFDVSVVDEDTAITALKDLPSAQPEIIRCKDCIYQTESWSGIKYCEAHGDHIGKDYDYCSNVRKRNNE